MENDPLYRLDKSLQDEIKAKEEHEFFEKLIDSNNHQWQDPFTRNQHLRKKFRHDKKERIELQRECNKIAARIGTTIPILPESSQDQSLASEQILKNQGTIAFNFNFKFISFFFFLDTSLTAPNLLF
ncbi:hypothetical protein HMI55_000525 [Coelomomyces lativittatus]|nr:hypothetical protein HMI55_000525 [Coelomomyces lativittatus]